MAKMFLFVLGERQASFHKQDNQSHNRVLLKYQNADESCHSNKVVNKKRLVVQNVGFEGKHFRDFENVVAQCDGKHEAE